MIFVEGEYLEGYHFENIPQFNTDNLIEIDALSSIAGMRAVWLLYLSGRWDYLEDLGVDRKDVEPVLSKLNYSSRLTVYQAQQLKKKVPQLEEASKELRLAYALQALDTHKEIRMSGQMVIYHAEVANARQADTVVEQHKQEMEAAGGSIEAAHNAGRGGSIVMIKLPANLDVDPANLLPGEGLKFSRVRAQVIPIPKGEKNA